MEEEKQSVNATTKEKRYRVVIIVLSVLLALSIALSAVLATGKSAQMRWVAQAIKDHYYVDYSTARIYEAMTSGRLYYNTSGTGLLDRYSAFYTAEEYAQIKNQNNGSQIGIGIGVSNNCVLRVCGNSPADKAGIQMGMYFAGFGDSESEMIYTDNYSAFTAFLKEKEEDETFCLYMTEDAQGSNGEIYEVAKRNYTQSYVSYASASTAYSFRSAPEEESLSLQALDRSIPALPEDTAYIKLDQFYGAAASQLEETLKIFRAEGKTKLILDLRNNGGGYMSVMRGIVSFFTKEAEGSRPLAAVVKYKDGTTEKEYATSNSFYRYFDDNTQIYVLANYNTASASECLLGAMLDYGAIDYEDIYLSEIGGIARSYGKGIMQNTYTNSALGCAIKLTVARIYWPLSGTTIHDRGILPKDGANTVVTSNAAVFGDPELLTVVQDIQTK